jgi:hypothetical protein
MFYAMNDVPREKRFKCDSRCIYVYMVSNLPQKTAIQRILYMAILIRLCSWPRITKLLNSNENAKYVQAEMLVSH